MTPTRCFFLVIRRPPRSTPFPTRRSSDLAAGTGGSSARAEALASVRSALPTTARRRAVRSEETRLNSSHRCISYAVFCLKKKRQGDDLQERVQLIARNPSHAATGGWQGPD